MGELRKASDDAREIVDELLEKYHGELLEAGIRLDLWMQWPSKDDNDDYIGYALRHHGYPAAAIVRICSYKERAKGHGDAEITIDGLRWDEWSDLTKRSILDHELEHLSIKRDAESAIRRDDLDRPKLWLKRHDHEFGMFDVIAKRWGVHSIEVQNMKNLIEDIERKQLYFDFHDPFAGKSQRRAKPRNDGKAAASGSQREFKEEVKAEFKKAGILLTVVR